MRVDSASRWRSAVQIKQGREGTGKGAHALVMPELTSERRKD
jgi:hypothetical protein